MFRDQSGENVVDVEEILAFFHLSVEDLSEASGATSEELSRCVSDPINITNLFERAQKALGEIDMVKKELTNIFELIRDQLVGRKGYIDIDAEVYCWLEGQSLFHPLREGVPIDLLRGGQIQELSALLFEWQQELFITPACGGTH